MGEATPGGHGPRTRRDGVISCGWHSTRYVSVEDRPGTPKSAGTYVVPHGLTAGCVDVDPHPLCMHDRPSSLLGGTVCSHYAIRANFTEIRCDTTATLRAGRETEHLGWIPEAPLAYVGDLAAKRSST